MEIETIVKMLIVGVVLVVLTGAIILLLKGRGGDILAAVKNIFRFGG